MKIVSVSEMKEIESKVKEDYGIDDFLMMEHAAFSLYLGIEEEFKNLKGKNVLVIVGKGNNGGDALALARNLFEADAHVKIVLALGQPSSELAKKHLDILKKLGIECTEYIQDIFERDIGNADIVVDGILGTGVKNKIDPELSKIIDAINANSKFTVAVDVPTGMDSDTGLIFNNCVKANMTVTFGFIKKGMLLYPARSFCGRVKLAKIGIPDEIVKKVKINGEVTTFEDAKNLIPQRPAFSSKGNFGKVLIISGSKNYTGTPIMVTLGALKVGAGLAVSAAISPFNAVITCNLPEAISIPLEEKEGFLSINSADTLDELAQSSDVIAIGPGIGRRKKTGELVKHMVEKWKEKPMVIDADAINLISEEPQKYDFGENTILTPHPGEFSRLTSKKIEEIISNPVKHALEFSSSKNVKILLKGPTSVIAQPDGKYALNVTGNSALAKAGTGDILTGMIAGFVAQGLSVFDAARLSAYIHGRTAEIYAQNKSEASMLVKDLADIIPQIIKELEK